MTGEVAPAPEAPVLTDRARVANLLPSPLRPDLVIRKQLFNYEEYYVVKDPLALTYFRFQHEEAYIMSLLDGKRRLGEVFAQYQAAFPNSERTLDDLAGFINQLGMAGLMNINARAFVDVARRATQQKHWLVAWGKLISGVLFFKVPLLDPSPWLGKVAHALRFLWTRPFVMACLCLFAWTIGLLVTNASEFTKPGINFLSTSNLVLLWGTIVVIKTFHEFGHALTCRHFGGEVHEMGVALMCFTPCGYVDASDAWMMRHKRHKLYTTAAGVFTELVIASFAAHAWLLLPDGLARNLAFNAMIVASINTLVFNINPLMRFDGYYVVCDLLEIPNLRTKAITFVSYNLQRFFVGYRNRQQEVMMGDDARGGVFWTYAVFAYLYMIFIIYGLTQIFARVLAPYGLHDVGLMLGIFVEGSFVALPFVKVAMDAASSGPHVVKLGPTWKYIVRSLAIAAAVWLALVLIPTRFHVRQQALVRAAVAEDVVTRTPGVVKEVLVKPGQVVSPGDPLVVLSSAELDSLLAQKRADFDRARLRLAALQDDDRWAALEGRPEAAKALEVAASELARVQADHDAMTLRARVAGVVLSTPLDRLPGRLVDAQVPLVRIADPATLRLLIPMPEDDAEVIEAGARVTGRWKADGDRFTTTVSVVPLQPIPAQDYEAGMLAIFGGAAPLANYADNSRAPAFPMYIVEATLPSGDHRQLVEGLRARVTVEGRRTTFAARLWRWFLRLWQFHGVRDQPA